MTSVEQTTNQLLQDGWSTYGRSIKRKITFLQRSVLLQEKANYQPVGLPIITQSVRLNAGVMSDSDDLDLDEGTNNVVNNVRGHDAMPLMRAQTMVIVATGMMMVRRCTLTPAGMMNPIVHQEK